MVPTTSRLPALAAVSLAIVGVLCAVPGLLLALYFGWSIVSGQPDPCGAMGCGWPYVFVFLGIVLVAVGGIHLLVARGMNRRREWARIIGLLLGLSGLLLSGSAVLLDLHHPDVAWLFLVVLVALFATATAGVLRGYDPVS